MPHFVAGRSLWEDCGEYVIVAERTLEKLEASAPIVRELLGRASRAPTVAEMGALLDELPIGYAPDWAEIAEQDFEVVDLGAPPPAGLYQRCVERFFYSAATEGYDATLVLDTTACYADLVDGEPSVARALRSFVETAEHDLDAGLEDLDDAMAALEAAGHTCVRDDERILHVFGYLMSDAYLRGEERS